jgi:cytochrome c biogenesis protein
MIRLFRIISSLQTGIILLVLLTLTSIAGVIVPQGLEAQRYINQWGTAGGGILLGAGLDHLFSTVWYNSLLGAFAVNVLLCTVRRLRAIAAALFSSRYLAPGQIDALAHHAEINEVSDVAATASRVRAFFIRKRFTVARRDDGSNVAFDIRKGRVKDLGSALLHFCLLPLLIGGLIGKIGGFSYMQDLGMGDTAPVRDRPFFVRCDFFALERNEEGDVKDYKSGLTLLDSAGDTLARKVIEVNHPLTYRGVKFYQSSYREDPASVDSVELVVTGPLAGAIGKRMVVRPGIAAPVGNTGLTLIADNFIPDFMYDRETNSVVNRSMEPNNPAILVTLLKGDETLFNRWVFRNFGAMHHNDDAYTVSFISYGTRMGTGLLVKENPGNGIIWLGIIGMSLGVMLVFWVPRRRFWVAISSTGNGTCSLRIGCASSRDDIDASERFESTVTALRKVETEHQSATEEHS